MVEVCFSSPQRVNWAVGVGREVELAVVGERVVVVGGIATAPAGTATTRTGEARPPLRFRQISSSSDLRGALVGSTTATSKPLGAGCVKSASFA